MSIPFVTYCCQQWLPVDLHQLTDPADLRHFVKRSQVVVVALLL